MSNEALISIPPSNSPRKRGEDTEVPPPLAGEARWGKFGHEAYTTRNKKALSRAKTLRKNMTDAESKLWSVLRGKQFGGCKFRRQQAIGHYIVDFVCMEKNIIIELDGGQHAEHVGYDANRTAFLKNAGYEVLRFWNNDVLQNIEGVAQEIGRIMCTAALPPSNSPRKRGEDKKEGTA